MTGIFITCQICGRSCTAGARGGVRKQSAARSPGFSRCLVSCTAASCCIGTDPSDILAGSVPKWQARDDVYQVGRLLRMLVKGDATTRLALRNPPAPLKVVVLRSLKGVHLAFTGILSTRRSVAAKTAWRASAVVHGGPSARTAVVLRGRPNLLQAAGREAGLNLMEIKRLRAKGRKFTLLERQFWRLARKR